MASPGTPTLHVFIYMADSASLFCQFFWGRKSVLISGTKVVTLCQPEDKMGLAVRWTSQIFPSIPGHTFSIAKWSSSNPSHSLHSSDYFYLVGSLEHLPTIIIGMIMYVLMAHLCSYHDPHRTLLSSSPCRFSFLVVIHIVYSCARFC